MRPGGLAGQVDQGGEMLGVLGSSASANTQPWRERHDADLTTLT